MLFDEIKDSLEQQTPVKAEDIYRKSYELLCAITDIIRNEEIDDPECFMRIDSIITLLNDSGIDTGIRHDF